MSPRRHPIVGGAVPHRSFTPRTCESAFGTPFYAERSRWNWDRVIGLACALIIVGVAAAFAAGIL